MKVTAYTIVAKNYFGLAEILGESIRKVNPDIVFNIFVADEIDNELTRENIRLSPFETCICKDALNLDSERWYNNAFKYNITEFCTYLKPHCFKFLFNNYDKVIYFDPDIYVFNVLDNILIELEDNFVVITPHITTLETEYTGDASQRDIMGSGIFNLGFVGLKKCENSLQFVDWWADRLENFCFDDKAESLFTDQKWMDFIFSFFNEGIKVSRDLGRNVAPWNFYEREINCANDGIYVINRITKMEKSKLTFVHFSGFNYKNLQDPNLNLPGLELKKYNDIKILFEMYELKVSEGRVAEFLNLKYSYNFFDNNIEILQMHRRFYRRILNGNKFKFSNPFLSTRQNSYYKVLLSKKLVDKKFIKNQVDRLGKETYNDLYKRIFFINHFFGLVKVVLGFKKYYLLTRFFTKYFKVENQFFLFDKNDIIKPK